MVQVVGKDNSILDLIVELNTEKQLFDKGIRSDGTQLPNYSPTSIAFYGKPNRSFTLKDSGDFYKSFIAFVDSSKNITIQSNPEKVDSLTGFNINLLEMYGEKIEGLTQESKEILNKKIIIPVEKYIKKNIFQV